jgi:hypothetical protein
MASLRQPRYLTKQGGRLAGSPGMVKAEKWGLKTMRESGADKSWLQECMVSHWIRGGKDEVKTVSSGKAAAIPKTLDVVALGNSMGSGSKGVKAEVLLVNSFNDLEEKKDQVKGKIVFYNYKFIPYKYIFILSRYRAVPRSNSKPFSS